MRTIDILLTSVDYCTLSILEESYVSYRAQDKGFFYI